LVRYERFGITCRIRTKVEGGKVDVAVGAGAGTGSTQPQPQREAQSIGDRTGGACQRSRSQERLKPAYGKLLHAISRVVGQAKRFAEEIASGVKRSGTVLKQMALEGLRQELQTMVPLVKQVMKQTRARIFRGKTRAEGKLLSLFEPSTVVIRKGKAAKPNELARWIDSDPAPIQRTNAPMAKAPSSHTTACGFVAARRAEVQLASM
jgi:hypothetical protein